METTLNYGLERVWCIHALRGSNTIAVGYDEGSVTVKLGREEPAVSMDSSGKILWAKHSEMQQANLKTLDAAMLEQTQGYLFLSDKFGIDTAQLNLLKGIVIDAFYRLADPFCQAEQCFVLNFFCS